MKLDKKGLKKRAEFLKIAIESNDVEFLNCLKDKRNLLKFNALCDLLKEVK